MKEKIVKGVFAMDFKKAAKELVAQMTFPEKMSQMRYWMKSLQR